MTYHRSYYEAQVTGCFLAARAILPMVFAEYAPESIIDVGCGTGSWLRAARLLGVPSVRGIDRADVPADLLAIDADDFRAHDLEHQPLPAEARFDLALCLEVAARVPPARAAEFVADLTALADVVLFSAAIPHQGGKNHVNEQFPSYWIARFQHAGFRCFDFLRPRIWSFDDIPSTYRQNVLLFSRHRRFPDEVLYPAAADRVHPALWRERNGPFGALRAARRALPPILQHRLTDLGCRIGNVPLFGTGLPDGHRH